LKKTKPKHWRAFPAKNAPKAAPVLEFQIRISSRLPLYAKQIKSEKTPQAKNKPRGVFAGKRGQVRIS